MVSRISGQRLFRSVLRFTMYWGQPVCFSLPTAFTLPPTSAWTKWKKLLASKSRWHGSQSQTTPFLGLLFIRSIYKKLWNSPTEIESIDEYPSSRSFTKIIVNTFVYVERIGGAVHRSSQKLIQHDCQIKRFRIELIERLDIITAHHNIQCRSTSNKWPQRRRCHRCVSSQASGRSIPRVSTTFARSIPHHTFRTSSLLFKAFMFLSELNHHQQLIEREIIRLYPLFLVALPQWTPSKTFGLNHNGLRVSLAFETQWGKG